MALLDELRYLLGDPPIVNTGSVDDEYLAVEDASLHEVFTASDREYAGPAGWTPPTNRVEDDGFAHVLVDEAQDLTPMQWRMVGRRGRGATWTIVGDPAQSSWPVPADAAAAREEALGDKPRHDFHLGDQLPELRGDLRVRGRLRLAGRARRRPARRGSVDRRRADRAAASTTSSRRCAPQLGELAGSLEGTVGVVVPVARLGEVTRWVSSWPEFASEFGSPDSRLVVLTGLDTKGLEFDGIVVVAPQEIQDESPTGRATLYVVYTRATQRMVTLTP